MNVYSVIGRVKSFLAKKEIVPGTLLDPYALGFGNSGTKGWLDLYNENPRLAVVHKIAEDNGASSYSIKTSNRKSAYYVDNHPFDLEIQKHSVPQFFSLWTAYLLMKGVVYIAFDLQNGNPTNFKIFTTIHLMRGGDDVGEYEFKYGTQNLVYPAAQVITDTDLDLVNPYFSGKGKAEAIKDEIETDEFVQKYIKYFYVNSARPDLYITAEKGEEMSETDVSRLESEWYRKFQGVGNAHKPVFLNWAANVFSVPTSHKDMELLDTRKFYRDTTIQHFGVPPEIMGIVENSNKATVIAAEHIYAKQVRLPILTRIALLINTKILPRYQDSNKMIFEFDNIIPDDMEFTQKLYGEGVDKRLVTVNEWRRAMGLPNILGEYGNSIVGQKTNAGLETPMVVTVESESLPTRPYKSYDEITLEAFKTRASDALGRQLEDQFIIVRENQNG